MTLDDIIYDDKLQLSTNVILALSEMIISSERSWKNFQIEKTERNALPNQILESVRRIVNKDTEIEVDTVQTWVDAFVSIANTLGLMDTIRCTQKLEYPTEQIIDFVEGGQIDWGATKERFPALRDYTTEQLNAALIEQYRAAGKTHPELEKLTGKVKAPKEKINIPFFKLNIEF